MRKKNLLVLFLAIIMTLSFVACGNKETEPKEQCIGTWEIVDNPMWYLQKMELYEGGTGKGFDNSQTNSWYTLEWEFSDDILNITVVGTLNLKTGYKLEGNTMTSVDGDFTYTKSEN